jgi:CBS domain containing-hemolysin-like protein
MIESILIVAAMVVLLLLKGFFSGSEIALVNADKIKLTAMANQGHKGAAKVLKLFRTPDELLGTTLVGTNIATVALTTIGTMVMFRVFGERGDLYAFLIFTPILLILGEIVPKSVYQQKSDTIAPIAIYPLRAFSIMLYPIIFIFSRIARLAARIAGAGKTDQSVFMTREKIRAVVEMAERASNVGAFDRGRIRRVIRFAETTVGEAMIPVAEMSTIGQETSTESVVKLIRKSGYNRLPVHDGNTSSIVGCVTLTTWDLMEEGLFKKPLSELVKPVLYVPTHQTIDLLLPELRKRHDHMAIVVDEYGSAVGLITLEDILEEVVGEIDVGYDFEEYLPKARRKFDCLEEDVYLMDSRLPISEVSEILAVHLQSTESHTIGGLVTAELRRIPTVGESITRDGYRFTVQEATDRSIIKIRVEPA